MHFHVVLLATLTALALASPLEERNSYPWVSAFDASNINCDGNPPGDQPYVKLKKGNHCYGFAPTLPNIGWSWGAGGLGFTVSRIKFYSDANCGHALLWADMANDTSKSGYCLPTKMNQQDYPQWNPNNPPILSVMSGDDD